MAVVDRPKCDALVAAWRNVSEMTTESSDQIKAASQLLEEVGQSEDVLGRQQDNISLIAMGDLAWKKLQGTYIMFGAYWGQVGGVQGFQEVYLRDYLDIYNL